MKAPTGVTNSKRRATAADVARDVGVSRATIGFVLNDTPGQTISAATRQRVFESAQRLGYRPRAAAQALASGKTYLVLLVLPDWPLDHSVRRYIEEASQILDEAGYTLVTWTPHKSGATRPLWEQLEPDVVVGFAEFSDGDIRSMHAHGITNIIPEPGDKSERAVGSGPALQVEHLHELGHRTIAVATTGDHRLTELARERAEVAADAAAKHRIRCLPPVAVDSPGSDRVAVLREWIDAGVTGIVAYNDEVAAMVIATAAQISLAVPDRLSVIGHDDSPLAALFIPPLSSIRLDDAALGRMVAEMTLAKIEKRSPRFGPRATFETVVSRASTAVAPSPRF